MSVPVLVLNLGHSVLKSLDDYTQAASEIYRHYSLGQNIVAVTSAQGDQTDILMAEARRIGPGDKAKNLAELITLGERRSAALLALALERVGAPAFVRQARDLSLRAKGSGDNARLIGLDVKQLKDDLYNHDIVVMPGYAAIGDHDRPALLGQGGADLTALYVAEKLDCPVLLLKDVDGIYEHDPKEKGAPPLRYDTISWDNAKDRAKVLVTSGAMDFARKNEKTFKIGTPGVPFYTEVGPATDKPKSAKRPQPLKIVMLGCGTIGGGVYRRIATNPERFQLSKIMVRDVQKYVDQGYPAEVLTTDFEDLRAARADIFIDVSGGIEPALGQTKTMLEDGVHVVSANKQAIAAGGPALDQFAVDKDAILLCSSAAGGGMPVLEMCIREAGNIRRVEALLNGTTNFMLDLISAGASYDEALKEAQDRGFAEADPSDDVNGKDAAAKIRLVARYGFGEDIAIDDISRDTIEGFDASGFTGRAKRVAICERGLDGKFRAQLRLMDLSPENFIAQAMGEEAHAVFEFNDGREYKIRGKGAGRWPTTESIMADLYRISEKTAFS